MQFYRGHQPPRTQPDFGFYRGVAVALVFLGLCLLPFCAYCDTDGEGVRDGRHRTTSDDYRTEGGDRSSV